MSSQKILLSILIILAVVRVHIHTLSDFEFPKGDWVKFEATIKKEVKVRESYQMIAVGDVFVFADLYPQFRIGDRLLISGFVDEKGRVISPDIQKLSSAPEGFVSGLREGIIKNIKSMLPAKEAVLVIGMVLGSDEIPSDLRQKLINTGTIHVVVVSGQNLMIIGAFLMSFAKYIGRRNSIIITISAIVFYAALTGFDTPVLRATIVVLYTSLGLLLGRQVNQFIALLFAAITIVLIWPASVSEVSFQLTFAASLGIITLGQILSKQFRRLPVIGEATAISIAAYAFTGPIILYHFGQISLIAPIANIFVSEAILPMMLLGFAISIISLIFLPVAQIISYLAYVLGLYFWTVVDLFDRLQVGKIEVSTQNMFLMLAIYGFIFTLVLWRNKNGRKLF